MSSSEGVCISDRIKSYIETYGSAIPDNSPVVMKRALELYCDYVRGEESIINYGNPRVTAASIYYIACVLYNTIHTQSDVCKAFEISRVALRRRYQAVGAKMGYIVLKPPPKLGFEPGEAGFKFSDKFYEEKWRLGDPDEEFL